MFAMLLVIVSGLVVASVTIHLLVLRSLSLLILRLRSIPVAGMGMAMVGAILGHLIEISLFAIVLFGLTGYEEFGHLRGHVGQTMDDYFYYSAVTYTSLGFGDVTPEGHLRLLSAVEALTGLVLIAWTASFAFFLMQRLWEDGPRGGK